MAIRLAPRHLALILATCLSAGCSDGKDQPLVGTPSPFAGTAAGVAGELLVGAKVYLVPANQVDTTPITPAGVLAGSTEPFDEPLEDLVAAAGTTFQQATTDAMGRFAIDPVADGRYFVFVEPSPADEEHIPGGSLCRKSLDAVELRGMDVTIELSSSPTSAATYVGMSVCLQCHSEYDTENTLAHRLGFRVPGVSSPLQDTSEHPEIDDGLAFFLDAAVYTGGTPVYFYDYDDGRGFDKFKTSLTDPTSGGGVVSAILWLWRDTANDTYKITIENVGNPAPMTPLAEREVVLTYGGAVYKQRYMIRWPGLNGLYPVLQYQTAGSDDIYDRTRQQFRDYHLDFFWDDADTPADPTDDEIAAPQNTKNIERNCMGCHAPGYTQFTDMDTMEVLCDSVEDPLGEFDIDGDGHLNDLNVSCESCHGRGSEHVAGVGADGRWILTPENMSPSREIMICGRCHDRQVGNGTIMNDHPLNAMDEFPEPGISRATFLSEYVSRKGPSESNFWPDFEHSKSHHQQAPDFVRSRHYRNPSQLLTCFDCHNMHGGTGFDHGLVADPDAAESPLCMSCHEPTIVSTAAHTEPLLGFAHGGFVASCVECHMTKTAKTGAGNYGFQLSPPTGTAADEDTAYFENDITSHLFDVIPRTAIQGVQPQSAMPVPYTNRCGTCHDPSSLPF